MNIINQIKKRIALVIIIAIFALCFSVLAIFALATYRSAKNEPAKIIPAAEENAVLLEGWTNEDIDKYFKESAKWQGDEFFLAAGYKNVYGKANKQEFTRDFSKEFSFLSDKPENLSLEGYLFPDTYRIYSSSTPEEIIFKMLNNFDKKLTPKMREDIKESGKTIHEILTMASIIEKEAPIYAQSDSKEAKIISGIFWNRVNINMGLQSDATLSYIYNDKKPVHSGKELEIDSAYNTYKYRGLPPGPIANPGIIAIEAAIYPSKTNYYYFLTTLDGSAIYYAKTYEEHLKNKYKYLK